MCFDNRNDVSIYNRWEAKKGKVLHINIEKCSGTYQDCATDEEIEELVERNQILFGLNTAKYNAEDYSENFVQKVTDLLVEPLIIQRPGRVITK